MSWQPYIDRMMVLKDGKKIVQEAAICGLNPPSVWASTPGYASIPANEIETLAGDRKNFSCKGPCINGVKCMLLKDDMDDDKVLSLNLKTAADCCGNKYNICVGKTKQALVIVKGEVGDFGGALSGIIFDTVDYLKKANY